MKRKYAWIITCAFVCIGGMVASFFAGRYEGSDYMMYARRYLIVHMQTQHHCDCTSDSARSVDHVRREKVMEHFTRSLKEYRCETKDSLLDTLLWLVADARVASFCQADTMGVSQSKPGRLSVIPLCKDEYLLFTGAKWIDGKFATYYEDQRLIVLYVDDLNPDAVTITDDAKIYLHELCHDLLAMSGRFPNDIPAQHSWIAQTQSRLSAKLAQVDQEPKDSSCVCSDPSANTETTLLDLPVEDVPVPKKERVIFLLVALHEESLVLTFS